MKSKFAISKKNICDKLFLGMLPGTPKFLLNAMRFSVQLFSNNTLHLHTEQNV